MWKSSKSSSAGTASVINEMSPQGVGGLASGSNKKKGPVETDSLSHESMEEKKERVFKWTYYQTVKFTQEAIKETLLQNINVLRFLNLLESFDNSLMVWGSNESLQFGLNLKKDLSKYYQQHASKQIDSRIQQEMILQKILQLKNQNEATQQQQ